MSALGRMRAELGAETLPLAGFLALVVAGFSLATPLFLTAANLSSMAFQMPVLGLLTLAMLVPLLSGGLNLAVIFTANLSGLALAWTLIRLGGPDAGLWAFAAGASAALLVGALAGLAMGLVVAYVGAHPILVSLAMMIFLRGLGEFLTRGGDISGFPEYMNAVGHGSVLGIPVPMIVFAAAAAALVVAVPLLWTAMSAYQKDRVLSFLDPGADPGGAGYQILQSKIAIGSGGAFGRGAGEGTQSQLGFLPENHTDFIFTSIAEEFGFAGALFVLALYVLILAHVHAIALGATTAFARLLALGMAVTLFLCTFVNVAMVTGLIPVVGMPLPFISYGGTVMLTLQVGFGLVLSARVSSRDREAA